MTREDLEWYIHTVQVRHEYLNLSSAQAEKIYAFEQDKAASSVKHALSIWEEWDFELTTFREILNDDQLDKHKKYLEESARMYEQALIEQDKGDVNRIEYYKQLLTYYETNFVPSILNDLSFNFGFLLNSKSKIDYLKAEYKTFLDHRKQEIISNHFRQHKTFKPNGLKASLLWHKLQCVLPDYAFFRQEMDEPTRSVADFLVDKIQYFSNEKEEFISGKFGELEAFNTESFNNHHAQAGGWHMGSLPLSPEEQRAHRTMTLLLLDRNRYGF